MDSIVLHVSIQEEEVVKVKMVVGMISVASLII
jgi:hypothetical protein